VNAKPLADFTIDNRRPRRSRAARLVESVAPCLAAPRDNGELAALVLLE
jgi:hypothetical protein